MMKTIGLVLSQPPAYSETFFNTKIQGLQESGCQVILFVQTNPNNFKGCELRVAPQWAKNPWKRFLTGVRVGFKLLTVPQRVLTFVKWERQADRSWQQLFKNILTNSHLLTAQLDWLHFGFTTLAIQSEHVAKTIGAKMAVSFRGFDMDVFPLKHPDCYSLVWQELDKGHTISDYLLQRAYQWGLPKEVAIQKITPAINTAHFSTPMERPTRKAWQLLTIARLHWIKGLTETLEALAILKQQGIPFKYTIIGTGELYESLCFTIHQLGLKEDVRLIGKRSHKEVITHLQQTDIYIQYSQSEGFCNAVLEAQAAGVLCVVSNGGGLPENVIHQKTGWVVPKRQPKRLATQLMEVINSPDTDKEYIRRQAKARIESDFTMTQQQAAFKAFYEKA